MRCQPLPFRQWCSNAGGERKVSILVRSDPLIIEVQLTKTFWPLRSALGNSYLLPNDETENDRLDMFHELCLTLLHRKLYLAPIKNPQRVIDLGQVSGQLISRTNIPRPSPVQPTMVPPNVKFLVDDIESEWAYESDPFDLIHARYLAGSIRDFGKLVKQCYRSVKPGGWVEFQDWDGYPMSPDGSLNGTALQQYYDEVYGAFEEAGYEVRPGSKLSSGSRRPEESWRLEPDPGRSERLRGRSSGTSDAVQAVEEGGSHCPCQQADGRNRKIHMMFDFYVVYAQRPEN
ncbi:hypothetical protein VTN31DRAFT_5817 [Thermomyces dupontii]|uniref:uncharacterized protein n=1 Tax=Talaromyces thermophilus TaxID=28565 RepID=UPI0037443748